ncbi:MAG TPA: hypothetical protein VKB81_05155 [Nitrospira sp.]|nr:hypothetical protein [Nitrospira sp.]
MRDSSVITLEEREVIKHGLKEEIEDVKSYVKTGRFRRVAHWLSVND